MYWFKRGITLKGLAFTLILIAVVGVGVLWQKRTDIEINCGPDGCEGSSSSGMVRIGVGSNTLSEPIALELREGPTAEASATPNPGYRSVGRMFWMWPQGSDVQVTTVMTEPLTVTVSYRQEDLRHLDEEALGLFWLNEETGQWEMQESVVDRDNAVVTAQTTKMGSFDLQAPLLCPGDETEPYDDEFIPFRNPELIVGDAPASRLFDIADDVDWFQFEAWAGEEYVIQTLNLAGNADTVLVLYDVDGATELARDDSSGEGRASRIRWTAHEDGMYYVKAYRERGGYGCETGYEIQVVAAPL